jgi:hypothetical protein
VFFFDPQARYLNGCYDSNVPVSHFSISNLQATGSPVINANWTVPDVRLGAGVHISGLVLNTSGVALPGITVEAYAPTAFGYQEYTPTLADGTYSVLIPPNASYTLSFTDYSSGVYSTGYYDSAVWWSHLADVDTSATLVSVGNVGSDVGNINVTMTKPWSLQISVGAASVVVGTTVTLTATTNQQLQPTPYYCVILDSSNTVLVSYGSGMTCTTTVTSATPASKSYHAVVGYSDGTGAVVATSPLTVTWVPDHLVVTPNGVSMAAGGSQPFSAEGYDGSNNDLGNVTASTNFTISGIGSCFAASCTSTFAGDHTVTGHDGSATGTATLHVTPAAPNFLVLSPSNATMAAGMSTTYTAVGSDQYDNGTGDVTSATTFAISGDGSCTGATCTTTVPGDHTITGTNGSAIGTTTLHATVGALDHLVLSPDHPTITAGQSVTFTATGFDKYGDSEGDVTSATTFGLSGAGDCVGAVCTPNKAGMVIVSAFNGNAYGNTTINVGFGGATYHSVGPVRILDSRSSLGDTTLVSRTKQTLNVTGSSAGVPAGAVAVTGNLTIVGQTALGYVSLAPSLTSGTQPGTSTINFPVGDIRANGVTVPLSDAGTIDVMFWASSTTDTVNVLFDVTGYFANDTTGATYHSVGPVRILDSRSSLGDTTLVSRTKQTLNVTGSSAGVPAGAIAVTGNLTVVGQSALGYVSLAPSLTTGTQPGTSTINFPVGDIRANGVTVPLSDSGTIDVMFWASSTTDTVNVLFDVTGYFSAS